MNLYQFGHHHNSVRNHTITNNLNNWVKIPPQKNLNNKTWIQNWGLSLFWILGPLSSNGSLSPFSPSLPLLSNRENGAYSTTDLWPLLTGFLVLDCHHRRGVTSTPEKHVRDEKPSPFDIDRMLMSHCPKLLGWNWFHQGVDRPNSSQVTQFTHHPTGGAWSHAQPLWRRTLVFWLLWPR